MRHASPGRVKVGAHSPSLGRWGKPMLPLIFGCGTLRLLVQALKLSVGPRACLIQSVQFLSSGYYEGGKGGGTHLPVLGWVGRYPLVSSLNPSFPI